nr:integrase, catalytic region, zinc finger, CCHC-type, peptidase aspartic, catalytic [Tanacetum cinerariifolium]
MESRDKMDAGVKNGGKPLKLILKKTMFTPPTSSSESHVSMPKGVEENAGGGVEHDASRINNASRNIRARVSGQNVFNDYTTGMQTSGVKYVVDTCINGAEGVDIGAELEADACIKVVGVDRSMGSTSAAITTNVLQPGTRDASVNLNIDNDYSNDAATWDSTPTAIASGLHMDNSCSNEAAPILNDAETCPKNIPHSKPVSFASILSSKQVHKKVNFRSFVGEYSQWRERFMNYLEEQTDGEAMINSIQNGHQPLPVIAQVSLARNAHNATSTLKDPKFWTAEEKKTRKIDRLARSLLIQGLPNDIYSLIDSNETAKDLWDALERQMRGSEYGEQDRKAAISLLTKWKQYGKLMGQTKNLMDINIDALYNILKQNQGDVNDALGYKKKAVVVTSDPLTLVAEKTKVTKQKEKVVVSSDSERSGADDFSELKKITALTSSTSQSANKKQEFVKSDDKKIEKKDDEKKRDMSKHKTGNRALLTNFVEKFLGTVRFGNNDFAVIAGYGDVVIGSMTIKKVYYVEGLGHNLFSVRKFCDKGLEVAFGKSTCFVRNEDGVDLLTGDRSSNLHTIALNEVASNSSTCLLAKASSSQSWLWHQRLSHLNFATINNLVKKILFKVFLR